MSTDPWAATDATATPGVVPPNMQSLRFLLMRYARSPSPFLAGQIAACLDELLTNESFRIPPKERCIYRQMRTYWRLVERLG